MPNGKYLFNALLFVVSVSFFTGVAIADCPDDSKSAYKKILKRAVKSGLPATLYYYQNSQCKLQLAKGYSNLATKTKLQKQDRFITGSISKIFIGVISVKLAETGTFSLDDNIKLWLPPEISNHIPNIDKITIRNLLSHTSGIVNYTEIPAVLQDFLTDPYTKRSELDVFSYVADLPLLFEPGTAFSYSNTNYVLMGVIINSATNKHFTQVIREQIIQPLALNNTFHLAESSDNYLDYSHGYMEFSKVLLDTHDMLPNFAFADGSIVSTSKDLSVFIQAIFTNQNFISPTLLATLLSSPVSTSRYGLGMNIYYENYTLGYGHRGAEPGYRAFLSYIPANNETIVSFVNASNSALTLFANTYNNELKRERIRHQRSVTLAP